MFVTLAVSRVLIEALNPTELRRLARTLPKGARGKRRAQHDDLSTFDDTTVGSLFAKLVSDEAASGWTSVLQNLLYQLEVGATKYDPLLTIEENFAAPVASIISRGFVETRVEETAEILSDAALTSLISSLRSRLALTGRQAIAWTWNAFCTTPGLPAFPRSDSTRRRLAALYFAGGIEHCTRTLLCRYPALARLWAVQSQLWTESCDEFLHRSRQFLHKMKSRDSSAILKIAELAPERSDLHRGNRSVVYVALSDKSGWYYKPRSGAPEALWESVLSAINVLQIVAPVKLPRLIRGRGHFWMEAMPHRPCRNQGEAAEFYYKAGLMCYLLYRLRGVDFHAGNLVACGPDPVLVDCETLLHPTLSRALCDVLATGFLPLSRESRAFVSQSALGRMATGDHSVQIGERCVGPSAFVDELVAGFTAPVLAKKDGLVTAQLRKILQKSRFRRCRHLFRSTGDYAAMMQNSLDVGAMMNGVARGDYLRLICQSRRNSASHALAEMHALEQGDIPIFYGSVANLRSPSRKQVLEQAAILREAALRISRSEA